MQSQTTHNSQSTPMSSRTRLTLADSWSPLKNLPSILTARTSFKVNEEHLLNLAIKARLENRECGYLSRRGGQDPSSSPHKWQLKWFVLYQNLLFYYENVNSSKPQGVYFLESCYSFRSPAKNSKDGEKLVSLFAFFTLQRNSLRRCFSILISSNVPRYDREMLESTARAPRTSLDINYGRSRCLPTSIEFKFLTVDLRKLTCL